MRAGENASKAESKGMVFMTGEVRLPPWPRAPKPPCLACILTISGHGRMWKEDDFTTVLAPLPPSHVQHGQGCTQWPGEISLSERSMPPLSFQRGCSIRKPKAH